MAITMLLLGLSLAALGYGLLYVAWLLAADNKQPTPHYYHADLLEELRGIIFDDWETFQPITYWYKHRGQVIKCAII